MSNNTDSESEEHFQVKLAGINKRSYYDVAFKVDSTVLSLEQEDQDSQIGCSALSIKQKQRVMNQSINKHSIYDQLSQNLQNKQQKGEEKIEEYSQSDKANNNIYESSMNEQSYFSKQSQSNNLLQMGKQTIVMEKHKNLKQLLDSKKSIIQIQKRGVSFVKRHKKSVIDQKIDVKTIIQKTNPLFQNFINKYTLFGRQKQFNDQSRILFGDSTDGFCYLKQIHKFSFLLVFLDYFKQFLLLIEKIFIKILQNLPLFNPENKFRIFINVLIVCYNCFFLMTISFTIFFKADLGSYFHLFNNIAIVAWVSEMLLQMNTATYHDGDFITDRKTIFRIYLKEYFLFELLPLIFEGKSSSNAIINTLLHFPLLLKLKGMSIILVKLEFLILQHLRKPQIMQICKQLLQILLLIHLMACSYASFGFFEKDFLDLPYNWISQSKHFTIFQNLKQKQKLGKLLQINNNWWGTYFEALLWAFYTMGNSYSSSIFSEYEYAFTSFWMLISSVLFAYNITTLGNILQDINSAQETYKKDLNLLNRYMKRKKIDIELQREMNSYFVRQYEQDSSANFEAEKEALKKLNINMRNKLIVESNKHILKQFSFFNAFSQQTLQNIYQIMEERIFLEGEIIKTFDQNSADHFLYLILKGSGANSGQNEDVNLSKLQNFQVISTLKEGNMFGECEFFSNQVFPYYVQACQKVFAIKISSYKFQEIIKQNKKDFHKFMELKSRIQFNEQINLINSFCLICKSKEHQFVNCNQVHFSVPPNFLIPKHNFSVCQKREIYNRKRQKGQKYIIEFIQEQIDSNLYQDKEEFQSLESDLEDDKTSIFKSEYQQASSQNSVSKNSRIDEQSKQSSSPNSQLDNQFAEILKSDVLNQIKAALTNLNGKRMSIRQNINQIKYCSNQEVKMKSNEKFEIPVNNEQGKLSSILEDNQKNSENNLGDLLPQQISNCQIMCTQTQTNKSANFIPSLNKITKSKQLINQLSKKESFQETEKQQNFMEIKNQINMNSQESSYLRLKTVNQQAGQTQHILKNQESLFHEHQFLENLTTRQWNGSITYWSFDKLTNFVFYYPQHNFINILKSFNKTREKKLFGINKRRITNN